jgi:release factor family 11
MLYVDIPTLPEFRAMATVRADACVSIYVPTTPVTTETGGSRIEFKNLSRQAIAQLEDAGFDKRRLADIAEQLDDLGGDDVYWRYLAHSLAVLATPELMRTFRLPNRLTPLAEVSDRFHLKPLIRAITFPNAAFVLALSENAVRLIEVFTDLPPQEVAVPDLPKSAAEAAGPAAGESRSSRRRLPGAEGKKALLRKYARRIDAALREVLAGRETPLMLASTEPLSSIFRSVNTYPQLLAEGISVSPDRIADGELAAAARPILDRVYGHQLEAARALFESRKGQGRATNDIADAARAATFGAIEWLMIDIDEVIPGTVDDTDGRVTFADGPSATTYGIVDEIASRALVTGARVLGVRKDDIPGAHLAASLRYPV